MTDQFAYWKALRSGATLPITEGKVESGYYWAKASSEGGRIPVVVWRESGVFQCRWGTKLNVEFLDEDEALNKWTWFGVRWCEKADYEYAYEKGVWRDGSPTTPPVTNAHNQPSDPFEALKAILDDKMASAKAWLKANPEAKTQVEASQARNTQAEILAFIKQADALHKTEKAPILEAEAAVELKFQFRKVAKAIADELRGVYQKFAVAEEERQNAEAQAKYEAERKAAIEESIRISNERAKLLRDDPIAALTSDEPEMPEIPTKPEPVKVRIGGGVGRAAGLKTVLEPEIEDYTSVLKHFANHDDVRKVVEKLVRAEVRAAGKDAAIPGVKVKEVRKAA